MNVLKHLSLVVAGCLAFAATADAQHARTLQSATAAAAGMDEATLRQAAALYREAFDKGRIRGAVLLVARHGKIVMHEAIGWKNHAYGLPMEKDTIFQMASTTKPFATTGILMLEHDGKLSSDPASKYLASFRNDKSKDITIAELASGTSGFRIRPIMYHFEEEDGPPTLLKAVDKFGKEGPAVERGTSFSYSNAAFNTLGALIEQVPGTPLEEFWIKRIYEPLGMTDTLNHSDPSKLRRMATHYGARANDDGTVSYSHSYTPGDPPEYPVVRASGGLVTTARDYATFLQMYLDGGYAGSTRILSAESIRKITAPVIKTSACPPAAAPCNALTPFGTPDGSYAMGWFVSDEGVFSHLGGGANNGRYVWADPKRDLLGVALTTGGNDPRKAFQSLIEKAVVAD